MRAQPAIACQQHAAILRVLHFLEAELVTDKLIDGAVERALAAVIPPEIQPLLDDIGVAHREEGQRLLLVAEIHVDHLDRRVVIAGTAHAGRAAGFCQVRLEMAVVRAHVQRVVVEGDSDIARMAPAEEGRRIRVHRRIPLPVAPAFLMPFHIDDQRGERDAVLLEFVHDDFRLRLIIRGPAGEEQAEGMARGQRRAPGQADEIGQCRPVVRTIGEEIPVLVPGPVALEWEVIVIHERGEGIVEEEIAAAREHARTIVQVIES